MRVMLNADTIGNILVVLPDERDFYVQSDDDFMALASSLGWDGWTNWNWNMSEYVESARTYVDDFVQCSGVATMTNPEFVHSKICFVDGSI